MRSEHCLFEGYASAVSFLSVFPGKAFVGRGFIWSGVDGWFDMAIPILVQSNFLSPCGFRLRDLGLKRREGVGGFCPCELIIFRGFETTAMALDFGPAPVEKADLVEKLHYFAPIRLDRSVRQTFEHAENCTTICPTEDIELPQNKVRSRSGDHCSIKDGSGLDTQE